MAKEPKYRTIDLTNSREYFYQVKQRPYHILAKLEDNINSANLNVAASLLFVIDNVTFKLKGIRFDDPNEVWSLEYCINQ